MRAERLCVRIRNTPSALFTKRRLKMEQVILKQKSFSEEETEKIGEEFAKRLQSDDFLQISGEMGAGKTAFVRGLARYLCPKARIQSPTYTVMRNYDGLFCRFYHFDFYRITSEEDLESVGFFDCKGIVAAEWCENVPYVLPDDYYLVSIEKDETENERTVRISRITQ